MRPDQNDTPGNPPIELRFGGCDYLGFSRLPEAVEAARATASRLGLSTTASRTTTGDTPEHRGLEAELTRFLRCDAVTVLPDGYTANIAVCEALAGSHPIALIDARAHASLQVAARAGGLQTRIFDHRSPDSLRALVRAVEGPAAILTDGVFTADGAIAPLPELLDALPQDAVLVVDDCHGLGTLGEGGRGTVSHFGMEDPRILITGTHAKALGSTGGFVAGPAWARERILARSTAYICTTPAPPAMIAAARAALRVLDTRSGDLLARLDGNTRRLRDGLRRLGIETGDWPTPIAAFDLGDRNILLQKTLREAGLMVPLQTYPGGPSSSYFRATVSAIHTPTEIGRLMHALAKALGREAA